MQHSNFKACQDFSKTLNLTKKTFSKHFDKLDYPHRECLKPIKVTHTKIKQKKAL